MLYKNDIILTVIRICQIYIRHSTFKSQLAWLKYYITCQAYTTYVQYEYASYILSCDTHPFILDQWLRDKNHTVTNRTHINRLETSGQFFFWDQKRLSG